MRGIIWCKDENNEKIKGEPEIFKVIKNYALCGIRFVEFRHATILETFAEFENGDIWQVIIAKESQRGRRCNISYIDCEIDFEIRDNIILPATTGMPFNGIRLF